MLPWRRIILIVLGTTISFVVAVGVYKTLTLPEGERYSGDFWIDQIVNGIGQGAILALIALGYTLVYGILRMINFAHGEVFMAGAFISFFFADAYVRSGFLNSQPYTALAILLVVSVAASTLVAVLLERIAYRPLRNAPRLVPLITAIGASLFIAELVPWVLRAPALRVSPADRTRRLGRAPRHPRRAGPDPRVRHGDRGDGGLAALRASQQDGPLDARRGRGQ